MRWAADPESYFAGYLPSAKHAAPRWPARLLAWWRKVRHG